jgi:hypothetical protein
MSATKPIARSATALRAPSKEAAPPTVLFRARTKTKPVASEATEFGFPPACVLGHPNEELVR